MVRKKIMDVRYISVIILALMTIACVSEQAESQESGDKWLNIALSGAPATQNPVEVDDAVSTSVLLNNVYETLARYGKERRTVEPALAIEWVVSEHGKVWIVTLRDDIYFHDGTQMTADDVVSHFRSNPNFVGEIESDGKLRVRFIFEKKRVEFIKTITQVDYAIVKRLEGGELGGTGPFVIWEWDTPRKVILRSNGDYWGKRPELDGVTFHCNMGAKEALDQLREGKIDVIDMILPDMVEEIENDRNIVLSNLKGTNITFVHININNPPLDSAEFRIALNEIIKRKKIIRDVLHSQGMECRGLLPPIIGGKESGDPRIPYEPDRAKNVIRQYLADSNRVFKMVGLPFPRPYCPEPNKMARIVAGYLQGAGIKSHYVQVNTMDEYLERIAGEDYDFIVSGWILDSRNPDDFYSYLFGLGNTPALFNIHWESREFEDLILESRRVLSLRRRWEYYNKAEDIFFNEMPWILLAHTNKLSAYLAGVRGLSFGPTGEIRLSEVRKINNSHHSYGIRR